jgi:hypothetical protein
VENGSRLDDHHELLGLQWPGYGEDTHICAVCLQSDDIAMDQFFAVSF